MEDKRKLVRKGYAKVAKRDSSCCNTKQTCCGSSNDISRDIGYTNDEINSIPEGANLGLGCGNPTAISSLKEGETVLDLGSGGGIDCFLASKKVGDSGKVIGVDMTPEMLEKARINALKGGYQNVEFRLGEIEHLPVSDSSIDVIISNCVINLSPEKDKVFSEAFRVLKKNGRLIISDIVLLKELPEEIYRSEQAYISCISGAILKESYLELIKEAGFSEIRIVEETNYPVEFLMNCIGDNIRKEACFSKKTLIDELGNSIISLKIIAYK